MKKKLIIFFILFSVSTSIFASDFQFTDLSFTYGQIAKTQPFAKEGLRTVGASYQFKGDLNLKADFSFLVGTYFFIPYNENVFNPIFSSFPFFLDLGFGVSITPKLDKISICLTPMLGLSIYTSPLALLEISFIDYCDSSLTFWVGGDLSALFELSKDEYYISLGVEVKYELIAFSTLDYCCFPQTWSIFPKIGLTMVF